MQYVVLKKKQTYLGVVALLITILLTRVRRVKAPGQDMVPHPTPENNPKFDMSS